MNYRIIRNPCKETALKEMERSLKSTKEKTDASVQTDRLLPKDESCQTDKLEKTDFEIQVDMQPEELRTLKRENEIGMPNIPTSSSSRQAKKRKVSFSSDSDNDSGDEEEPQEDNSEDEEESQEDNSEDEEESQEDYSDDEEEPLEDDSEDDPKKQRRLYLRRLEEIMKESAAYKIFCQTEDYKKAIDIDEVKRCSLTMEFAGKMAENEGIIFIDRIRL